MDVDVQSFSATSEVRVSIYSNNTADDTPGTLLQTLSNPPSVVPGLNEFIADNLKLSASTKYHVLIEAPSHHFDLDATPSNAEDAGSAPGWSIADHSHFSAAAGMWRTTAVAKVGIRIRGVLASPNIDATGQPAITGTARVGQTLTADLSGIADEDGTTKADNDDSGFAYAYQWIRVDGETETNITNATTSTYTLTAEDEGKTVKVTVEFTDDAFNDEGPLVSEPYPATGTIALADGNHPATGVPAITGTAPGGPDPDRGPERARGRGRHRQGGQ